MSAKQGIVVAVAASVIALAGCSSGASTVAGSSISTRPNNISTLERPSLQPPSASAEQPSTSEPTPTSPAPGSATAAPSPAATDVEPAPPTITAEQVQKVLKDHGLFYKTEQEYIDTAAALSRDGGFKSWVKTVNQTAQGEYPAAAKELAKGEVMTDIMAPWVAIYANKKGVSPNIVDWETTDLLRYIASLDQWPSIEEFDEMIETVAP